MTLRLRSVVDTTALTLSGRRFLYRLAANENYLNTPNDGKNLVAVEVEDQELLFTNTAYGGGAYNSNPVDADDASYLTLPTPSSDYRLLYEDAEPSPPVPPPPNGNYLDSFWFSCYASFAGTGTQTLVGGDFDEDPVAEPDPDLRHHARFLITVEDVNAVDNTYRLTLQLDYHDPSTNTTSLNSEVVINTEHSQQFHHLLVHSFISKDNTAKYWHCRWFIDGQFRGETIETVATLIRATLFDAMPPSLLAKRTSGTPWDGGHPYGTPYGAIPMVGAIDEVMLGTGHPLLSGGNPIVDAPWDIGEEAFPVRRFPDPNIVGISSQDLVVYGPVYNTSIGAGGSIYQVNVDADVSPGQTIAVSVRADNSSFAADNAVLPWSEWTLVPVAQLGQWMAVNYTDSGHGSYVQVRLRLTPSAHPVMVSPVVTSVGIRAAWTNIGSGTKDLPSRIFIIASRDLPARIKVKQSGFKDLPGRIRLVYYGTPVNLEGRIRVIQSGYKDLPCRIFQKIVYKNLPGRIRVYEPFTDLPCRINVSVRPSGYADLPCRIRVPGRTDLPGRVNVTICLLPCRIRVRQAGYKDLPSRLQVVPERPSDPSPLTADVPEAEWQTTSLVTFDWAESTGTNFPVVAYYWRLDRSATATPDDGWASRSGTSIQIELDQPAYGAGVLYFHVAARNTAGYFSNVLTYEVWYNSPPGVPGDEFIRVRSGAAFVDCVVTQPTISAHDNVQLTWSPGMDANLLDEVTYQLQISTDAEFSAGTIVEDVPEIEDVPFDLGKTLAQGIWFCRIRTHDGKQFSDWSSNVGSFRVNVPPGRPVQLTVGQL